VPAQPLRAGLPGEGCPPPLPLPQRGRGRGAGGEGEGRPHPLPLSRSVGKVRAALTPCPSPALRERGELVGGLGIVAGRRRRIATATLISSSSAPLVGEEGGLGGRCGSTSPLPLPQRGRGRGAGGKVRVHQKPRFSTTLADQRHGSAIIVSVRKLVINELDQKLKPLRIHVKGSYRGFLDCL